MDTDTRVTDSIYAVDYSKAEGYAWGRQDAAHDALPPEEFEARVAATDTGKSAEFAEAFATHRRAFREGQIGMAYNLRSAYEKFLRSEALPIGRPATGRYWHAGCEYCQRYARACGRHDASDATV